MRLAVVPFALLLVLAISGGTAAAQSLTLSPAVVPLGGRLGQSTTQRLTLFNGTGYQLSFDLVAKDVVVRAGERVFVDAGELSGSIAATAVFSARKITLGPGQERSVEVTVTLPARLSHRALVVLFQGTTRIDRRATVSIGSLLTFDLSGRLSVAAGALRATPHTASANASLELPVGNDGSEPAIVRGAAAIIDQRGALIGKVALDPRRLLPGERTVLRADYPGVLPSGRYRVVATIDCSNRSWSRTTELAIP
jgi:hypothetical protein